MALGELILRIALGFAVLFCLTRIMGRKEISQMTFFNFVSAIAIGSICGNLVVGQDLSIRNGVFALIGWALFTLTMDFTDIKFKAARKFTTGDPLIVIKNGKILDSSLKKARLDMDSLNAMLRQQNIFSMSDVDYAIFETNGKLSVMKKEAKQSITKEDMQISNTKAKLYPMATEVITDGKVLTNNLAKLNLDTVWLDQRLRQAGIKSASEVFYAEIQTDGSLYIDYYENEEGLLH